MSVLVTSEQFKKLYPKAKIDFSAALNTILAENKINTLNRVASFLAQCGTESGEFTVFSENLNYSAKGLRTVFGKYFTDATALQFERKPEAIASKVYANRLGNGTEASKEGWKFRGRGAIQLTGKSNYTKFMGFCGLKSLDETIEYIQTPDGIIKSAVWYWTTNNLNRFADTGDIKAQTKAINGGFNGLEHRLANYTKAVGILKANF